MNPCVLISVLQAYYYNCKKKCYSISFYDKNKGKLKNSRINSEEDFIRNLPDTFYKVELATDHCCFYIMQKAELGSNNHQILTREDNFDLSRLAEIGITEYALYSYQYSSDFINGGKWEDHFQYIKFDALLYVNLFRLIGECVSLILYAKGRHFFAHYIDGKILFQLDEPGQIRIITATLFQLQKIFDDHKVVNITPLHCNLKLKSFISSMESYCNKANLTLIREDN